MTATSTLASTRHEPALLGQTVVVIGGSAGTYPDAGHGSLFQFHDSVVRHATVSGLVGLTRGLSSSLHEVARTHQRSTCWQSTELGVGEQLL